jgi:acyl carrier protein
MEDAFDISIPVNVMADVRTVGELAGAVQALLA